MFGEAISTFVIVVIVVSVTSYLSCIHDEKKERRKLKNQTELWTCKTLIIIRYIKKTIKAGIIPNIVCITYQPQLI